ncbi:MAG: hypothetical protein HY718_09570 [Planctomycetes bacterium]|nr:hypothetical protein [Planctomycetota bacterium]
MPVPQLSADDLYQEEVIQARQIPPERKLALGLELFDRVRALMVAGIRLEHPEADDQTVHRILLERLELARRLENEP